ncbi:transcriptional regulator [Streptomyces armeniacus]|uniref:Transcriptional regulator n=1 Tax=Streptomyces armeniacus TaxID=83291 RepID=A0A345XVW3_9ACTN|nr:winged helix-turn-helix transcriptional regulator [Streptomyces armeniacus]AXK35779.1 transcriptional regulator [Streptomyces armeniacus]
MDAGYSDAVVEGDGAVFESSDFYSGQCRWRGLVRSPAPVSATDRTEPHSAALEQEKLVDRHRDDGFPYRVSYQLTPAAEELLVALVPLAAWAEHHPGLIKDARRRRREE